MRYVGEDRPCRLNVIGGAHRQVVTQRMFLERLTMDIKFAVVTKRGFTGRGSSYNPAIYQLHMLKMSVVQLAPVCEAIDMCVERITDTYADALSDWEDIPNEVVDNGMYVVYTGYGVDEYRTLDIELSFVDNAVAEGATIFFVPNMASLYEWTFQWTMEDWKRVEVSLVSVARDVIDGTLFEGADSYVIDSSYGQRLDGANILWPNGMQVVNGHGDGKMIFVTDAN